LLAATSELCASDGDLRVVVEQFGPPHCGLVAAIRQLNRLRSSPPTAERIRGMASRWRPWRSVAARILWHFYLSQGRRMKLRSG
jgi:3-methyladenine DNA glycosylase/8-oxoguanine DNA glycosylase